MSWRLRFWLRLLAAANTIRAPQTVRLWLANKALDESDWGETLDESDGGEPW